MFSRNVRRILAICLIVVTLISLALYYIPWVTPFDLELNAVKLDKYGKVIDDVPISIQGIMKNYLFQQDSIDVTVDPFDDIKWMKLSNYSNTNQTGVIFDYGKDWKKVHGYTYPGTCDLLFTDNFKYIVLQRWDTFDGNGERYYYVASADESVPIEEVIEYFRYLPPFG